MRTQDDSREGMIINWFVSFFGGETIISLGETAGEAYDLAMELFAKKNNFYGEVYSIVAYPFYL